MLYNYPHCPSPQRLYQPRLKHCTPEPLIPHCSLLPAWGHHYSASCLCASDSSTSCKHETWNRAIFVLLCLASFISTMPSRFVHVVEYVNILFLFETAWYSIIHSSVSEYLGAFIFWLHSAFGAVNRDVRYLCKSLISVLLGPHRSGIAELCSDSMFNSSRNHHPASHSSCAILPILVPYINKDWRQHLLSSPHLCQHLLSSVFLKL